MFGENSPRATAGASARRAILLAGLMALSLVTSALLVPRVSAMGQSNAGFAEASLTEAEQFQVMGANWVVRTNLTFQRTETIRVNVTSTTVDVGVFGGGGSLTLQRFDGFTVARVGFSQAAGGPPFVYTAAIDLSTLIFEPDMYYLRAYVDDTVHPFFSVTSAARIGAPIAPHEIETYTDDTFAHASDVFTPTSVVWVRVVGFGAADPNAWDLESFLDNASVVNGPNGGFDNFRRSGNAYSFSIDLSPWADAFNLGWSYTLSVAFGGPFFAVAKQIQVFEPTVTVASQNLAPATARQGATDVPILSLTLALDTNWDTFLGPAAFNLDRLRVTRTGSGTNADIAGVHLYRDANGNGALDPADPLLASASNLAGVPFPVWLGQAGVDLDAVGSSAPLQLLLTYDIAPGARVGNTDGAQIALPGDVDMPGTFAVINGLPASSGNVQITGTTVLTVTDNPGVAPGSAVQGQPDVAIDLLRMASNTGVVTVTSVSVTLAGTGAPSDIARASLHIDDGDGIYEPARDPALGSPVAFSSGGVARFSGLNFQVDPVGRDIWVVYDIAATATVGVRVGSSIPTNASVIVASGLVYNGTFPLDSGLTEIAGPTLTMAWRNLAPAQARQGRSNLTMLQLDLSVDFGQSTVQGFRIDKRGTSTLDSDVPLARIWLDANADGLFDSGDLVLGSQGFVGGTTVIGGLSLVVQAGAPRTLFVTFDISPTATTGVTVSARLANAGYVSVDPATVVDGPFPAISAAVLITVPGSGAYLTVGSVDLARWYPRVYAGETDVPMEKLYLTVDANSGTVTGMHVDKTGSSLTDADVAALKLYQDADGDGNFSVADTRLASTGFVGGIAIFANLNLVVPVNQPVTLFLVIDLSASASVGRTIAVYLGNHNYVVGNATTTIDPNSFPIDSSEVTIYGSSVSGVVRDANGSPIANATVVLPLLNLTVTTDANGAYAFGNVPMGSWYVIARAPGYGDGNVSVVLTPAAPSGTANFALSRLPVAEPATFLAIAIGGGIALIALLGGLFLLLARRRQRCPVCGKPKAADQEVCPECQARGLRPAGAVPPVPPPPQPPMPPEAPRPPSDEL